MTQAQLNNHSFLQICDTGISQLTSVPSLPPSPSFAMTSLERSALRALLQAAGSVRWAYKASTSRTLSVGWKFSSCKKVKGKSKSDVKHQTACEVCAYRANTLPESRHVHTLLGQGAGTQPYGSR